jgi:hypothetical protein
MADSLAKERLIGPSEERQNQSKGSRGSGSTKLLLANASMEGGGATKIEDNGKNNSEQVEARNDDGG